MSSDPLPEAGPNAGPDAAAQDANGAAPRDPGFDPDAADEGRHRPLADLPDVGFWDVLYGRRSIRKFSDESKCCTDQPLFLAPVLPAA